MAQEGVVTYKRVDDNQRQIVTALRAAGCTVLSLASIGKGCPDLVVGRGGVNYLLEVKDGQKPPSQRKLTADEQEWVGAWRGQVTVVETVEEALAIVVPMYVGRIEGFRIIEDQQP